LFYLLAEDLPKNFEVKGVVYSLSLKTPKAGLIFLTNQTEPFYSFEAAISESSLQYDNLTGWFLLVGTYGMAILKSISSSESIDSEYYTFYSHCRDSNGLFCSNSNSGKSILRSAGADAAVLGMFLRNLAKSLNITEDSQFELIPVTVCVEKWTTAGHEDASINDDYVLMGSSVPTTPNLMGTKSCRVLILRRIKEAYPLQSVNRFKTILLKM